MIPLDTPLSPPPGYLLVERLENPLQRGRIIIPDWERHRASDVAVVLSSSVEDYTPGDHILLGASVTRSIHLGERGEKVVRRVAAAQVLARVHPESRIINEGSDLAAVEVPAYEIDERLDGVDPGNY